MQHALLSLLLSGLGRDALNFVAGLAVVVVIAVAFTVSSVAAVFGAMAGRPPGDGPTPDPPSREVIARARSQAGRPYVWGGASPTTSFDCSGLVLWAYQQAGVTLPRTAQQQFDATARLSPGQLQPGDLVFFARTYLSTDRITHVGLYLGNGLMLNAPTEGDVIREMPVFSGFWGAHYAGAGRVRR